MTNGHIITKEMIESKEMVDVFYDGEKKMIELKLDEKERYIVYNKEMDITIIEIKDLINEKDYYLNPRINDNLHYYLNKDVFVVGCGEGKIDGVTGKIRHICGCHFEYSLGCGRFSSGSPVFLFDTGEVIGIDIGFSLIDHLNHGIPINSVILLLNNRLEIYKSGNYYIGPINNGLRCGKGTEYYKNGDIKYEGYFVNDKYEGDGKYIYENGNYYIGPFMNGLSHGKGILYYKNGSVKYEGNFVNDKYDGYGKYVSEDGNYYLGQFLNSLKHGKGKVYYKNGNIAYDGNFVNDKYEGFGKYVYESGNYYVGEFKNGLCNGKGVEYYKNGSIRYNGIFVDDNFI